MHACVWEFPRLFLQLGEIYLHEAEDVHLARQAFIRQLPQSRHAVQQPHLCARSTAIKLWDLKLVTISIERSPRRRKVAEWTTLLQACGFKAMERKSA